jgi:hypothetical protein
MKRALHILSLLLFLSVPAFAYDDVCADADDNSLVDIRDALMILQHSVELPSPCVTNISACDVDGTGVVDINDALNTLRHVVGYVFEMNCPFPAVITVAGNAPIGGLDFLLTYPADKSVIMGNCDFGAGTFGTSASFQLNTTQTRVAMIAIPSVVLPADVIICEGYGHSKTLQVSDVYAFDNSFLEVPVDMTVVPNLPVIP